MTGIHSDARPRYPDDMSADAPVAPNPRRFSIRLPRPLWKGMSENLIHELNFNCFAVIGAVIVIAVFSELTVRFELASSRPERIESSG